MMGGFGSGRWKGGGRDAVEDCRRLDVNALKKAGYIGTRREGLWVWRRDEEIVAQIGLRSDGDRLHLNYCVRTPGADWADVVEVVPIVYTPCHLGGRRPYFFCPGVKNGVACERRAVKLYASGRYFLCRRCYGLAYASQAENETDRKIRRANTLRMRLGGEPGLQRPYPGRPKGMWRRTYERRLDEIIAADRAAETAFVQQSGRLLERIGGNADDERIF